MDSLRAALTCVDACHVWAVIDASGIEKTGAFIQMNVTLNIDKVAIDELMARTLSWTKYEGVVSAVNHEKMVALDATGKQVGYGKT